MSIGLIGGLLLIIGSFFVFKGLIFQSVFIFFLADCVWVLLSLQSQDYTGACFIFVGMVLGLLAFLKMHTGKMRKNLKY